jgi:hypothetical protein
LRRDRIDYAVADAFGDVGILFAVLRSERNFGRDRNGTDHPETPSDVAERVL